MISTLGWIAILIILVIIALLLPTDNKEECYKKDPYTCLNCRKDCKWHDIMEEFEKMENKEN